MNTYKVGFSLAACLLMTACAGTPQTTTFADGSTAMRIVCDASAAGLNRCFERAGRSCGATGYTIVDARGIPIAAGRTGDAPTESMVKEYEMDQNSILIKCNP